MNVVVLRGRVASEVITVVTPRVLYLLLDKRRGRSPDERLLAHHGAPQAT